MMSGSLRRRLAPLLAAGGVCLSLCWSSAQDTAQLVRQAQSKVVKIFGAGGMRSLEHYQTGCLVSDDGLIVTVASYVLDSRAPTVVLDDGRRFRAEYCGHDPLTDVALLKIDAAGLAHFPLVASDPPPVGTSILALSNLYGVASGNEPVSVQRGVVSAIAVGASRRGQFQSVYQGPLVVVDAVINNPGAAGGALVDLRGNFVGLIAKESRSAESGVWLNAALGVREVAASLERIQSGAPLVAESTVRSAPDDALALETLGIVLVTDVVEHTPAFVDRVIHGSPAARAAVQPDDLIVAVDERLTSSAQQARQFVALRRRHETVRVTIERDGELMTLDLRAAPR
jgi:serine protease Do